MAVDRRRLRRGQYLEGSPIPQSKGQLFRMSLEKPFMLCLAHQHRAVDLVDGTLERVRAGQAQKIEGTLGAEGPRALVYAPAQLGAVRRRVALSAASFVNLSSCLTQLRSVSTR